MPADTHVSPTKKSFAQGWLLAGVHNTTNQKALSIYPSIKHATNLGVRPVGPRHRSNTTTRKLLFRLWFPCDSTTYFIQTFLLLCQHHHSKLGKNSRMLKGERKTISGKTHQKHRKSEHKERQRQKPKEQIWRGKKVKRTRHMDQKQCYEMTRHGTLPSGGSTHRNTQKTHIESVVQGLSPSLH